MGVEDIGRHKAAGQLAERRRRSRLRAPTYTAVAKEPTIYF